MSGAGFVPSRSASGPLSALPAATAQILTTDGRVAGVGFLAGDNTLITCAHVVRDAGSGPGGRVTLAFPGLPGAPRVPGLVLNGQWRAPEAEDIAIVETRGTPMGTRAVELGSATGCQGHPVRVWGFPAQAPPAGHFGDGVVKDLLPPTADAGPLLQLTRANDLTTGFSGGPVADEVTGLVIGMMTAFTAPDEHLRGQGIAYATPTQVLRQVRPGLAERQVRPYQGLEPFTAEHVEWFHGRDAAVETVLAALGGERRALLLLGPSGGGKSSLVQAGVLPALAAGALPGSDRWLPVLARPGQDLPAELHRSGLPGAARDGITEAARKVLAAGPARDRLLLMIDQFEELLTQPTGAQLATVEQLVAAIGSRIPLGVLLIMRDDFYPRLAAQAPTLLEAAARGGLVNLPNTLSVPELRAIITEPALAAGARFQDGLPNRIINDVLAADPAGPAARQAPVTWLPPLELALSQLWEIRSDGWLTHAAYQRIGQVTGALATWCDTALDQLSDDQRPVARRILTALVRPADPTHAVPATRQQVTLSDLRALATADSEGSSVDEVLAALTRHRIITTGTARTPGRPDDAGRRPVAELIHDALIRDWADLRDWVAEDHRFHEWLRRAGEQRGRWTDSGHPGDLLRGSNLAEGLDWARERGLPGDIADFLDASRAADRADRERERRRTRRLRQLLAGAAVALCLALIGAGLALWQRQTAVEERKVAQSRQLAAQSTALLKTDPDLAGLLAVHAYRTAATTEATISLYAAADQPLQSRLAGHTDSVESVAFSPDGRTLATAGGDERARLWDVATGRVRATFTDHDYPVGSVAFSPDGRTLATGASDGTVRLRDVATGRTRATLTGHTVEALAVVAFSPDGKTLVTGSWETPLRLWDVATGRIRTIFTGPNGRVLSVAFGPDGKTVATGSEDGRVRLWDLATGRTRTTLEGHTDSVGSVTFGPDGKALASGSSDRTVRLWDVATGRSRTTLTGHTGWMDSPVSVAFSPDGGTLATGSGDGMVRLWDVATGRVRATLTDASDPVQGVWSLEFSPNGRSLATGGRDGTVRLWDVTTRHSRATFKGHTTGVASAVFSPDGETLVTTDWDGSVRLWDVDTGRVRNTGTGIVAVAFAPDGKTFATGAGDGTVQLWEAATQKKQATLSGHTDTVWSVAFSPDGKTLASGSDDDTVRLWDVASGRNRATLTGKLESAVFSPDGKTLATSSTDGTVRLWDPVTGRSRTTLPSDPGEEWTAFGSTPRTLVFSPDGRMLATESRDQTVRLRHLDSGTARTTSFDGHTETVRSVAFSPDGKTLASGSDDDTVRLWDVATHHNRAVLPGHTDSVGAVAFSPDDRTLVTGDGAGTVRLWDVLMPGPAESVTKICRVVRRDFTPQERSVYFAGKSPGPVCSSE